MNPGDITDKGQRRTPPAEVPAEFGRNSVDAVDSVESVYWQRTVRWTLLLLAIWFGVTFVAAFFARELDFSLFGWPFSFWFSAQGALLLYLAIVCIHIWRMERLEGGMRSQS